MSYVNLEEWKDEVMKNRDEFLHNNNYGVDESKRPKPEGAEGEGWLIKGAFRKLVLE